MKNLSTILLGLLAAAVGFLFYQTNELKKGASAPETVIAPPPAKSGGARIAWVHADTLDAKFEWLKQQREGLEKRLSGMEATMQNEMSKQAEKAAAFQQKAEAGNTPRAELEAEYNGLMQEDQRLQKKAMNLEKQLVEDRKKALEEMYSKLEEKLKTISAQIGYDYILSYSRGGQVLLANDSLNITQQVLDMLNAKDGAKK